MKREYHRWFSPSLGRDMEVLIHGHAGARVLVFPTSMGKFFEWEDHGMITALKEHLENGWLQLFCVDSVDAESWYASWTHPSSRARQHERYEKYILEEVLPLSQKVNPNQFLMVVGADFGAYHAVNFAFRHPSLFGRVIGLSGIYTIDSFVDGYYDDTVYFNNPAGYIPNEHDDRRLADLQRLDIILAIGQDDTYRPNNDYLSKFLWDKGIKHAYYVWHGWAHDWAWWQKMVQLYIGGAG